MKYKYLITQTCNYVMVCWLCSIFNEVLIFEVANALNARL